MTFAMVVESQGVKSRPPLFCDGRCMIGKNTLGFKWLRLVTGATLCVDVSDTAAAAVDQFEQD